MGRFYNYFNTYNTKKKSKSLENQIDKIFLIISFSESEPMSPCFLILTDPDFDSTYLSPIIIIIGTFSNSLFLIFCPSLSLLSSIFTLISSFNNKFDNFLE